MELDYTTRDYHLKCEIKKIKITTQQERLGKTQKESMETNLVCFVPENNGQFTLWLSDHIFQEAIDVSDSVEDELSIETVAIVPFPIDRPVRIAYCAGRKELQKRHFVLMTEDVEDSLTNLDGKFIEINIRPSYENDLHGV
jgi:hypothetical protein